MENENKNFDELNDMLNNINDESREKFDSEQKFAYAQRHHHDVHQNSKNSKKRKAIKILLIILCVLLAVLLVLATTWFILYKNGEASILKKPDTTVKINSSNVINNAADGKTIEYNGKKYVYNEKITSILCLGIDKTELGTNNGAVGTGGQADAVYLIAMNTETAKYKAICISRDTVTDIGIYSTDGKYIGTQKDQLCLSFAYGDGKLTSCENTVKAVSSLFYGIPINTYFALDRSAIPIINDEIGGVTVPVFDENGNETGKTTKLDGYEAENYVHYRDITKLDSNNVRIKHQLAYLKAFTAKFISATKADLGVPVSLYNTSQKYASTNLSLPTLTYLTTKVFLDGKDIKMDFDKVKGTVKKGNDGYAEYIVDQDALTKMVVETYYTEVK